MGDDKPDPEQPKTSNSDIKKKYDEIKSQRASTKSNMTRVKNYVMKNKETISVVELECRMTIFEQYWKLWLSHQTALEKLAPSDTVNHELARGEAEDLYCETKSICGGTLQSRQSTVDTNASFVLPTTLVKSNLPQMKLPSFSGRYSDFPNFFAIFNKLVHDNDCLSTTEKYNHLRHCLIGPALRTIDALGKSAENYSVALSTLKKRYDNKNLIFQEHISEIMDMPKISKNSAVHLRNLVDKVSSHVNAMKTIGTESEIMHSLINQIVSAKLDTESLNKYEESLDYSKLPTWDDMYSILNKRCQILEIRDGAINKAIPTQQTHHNHSRRKSEHTQYSYTITHTPTCSFCSEHNHKIEKCSKFAQLSVLERYQKTKQMSLCVNCLRSGHIVKNCKSSSCKVCSKRHHTLLHRYEVNKVESELASDNKLVCTTLNSSESSISNTINSNNNSSSLLANPLVENIVFLATAIIQIKDITGKFISARALLDSGSQLNFITDRLAHLLHLTRRIISGQVTGICQNSISVKHEASVTIKSRLNNFTTSLNCWILSSITTNHPERNINNNNLQIPLNLELADPTFFKTQKIDLLIGAEKFFECLAVGQIKLSEVGPTLQKTVFGWVVSGRYQLNETVQHISATATAENNSETIHHNKRLEDLVEKFWEIEHINTNYSKLNLEQQNCETLFKNTIRLVNDRLMVKLPFKKSGEELGPSFETARTRFLWLEKKLDKKPEIKQLYANFLQEYLDLHHMEEITFKDIPKNHYFIPHQYVLRPESTTTKLRVVFNASCPTSTNVALNDILAVGPTVQNDIFTILLKFRCYTYAFTADVSKMYRQIWVYPEDRNFQLILWRDTDEDKLKIFRLKTLTYGTASAPYLATRCLNYLADQFSSSFPKASAIIKNATYVDDLISGGDTIDEVQKIQTDINLIFHSASLSLRKWYCNEPSLLHNIPPEDREVPLRLHELDIIRTLGVIWVPDSDEFRFHVNQKLEINSGKITKRSVLSDLAKLFDPLGLVNPVIVTSKLFMQELWLLQLSWDESLPQSLHERWNKFKQNLSDLKAIRIPRFVLTKNAIVTTEIHGFSDASSRAFGACIYIRTVDVTNTINVHLLAAKSKVAPSKKTRTLPVLELLAAELLSKLWSKIQPHYPKEIDNKYFWTDSTIVLGWIGSHASKWKTLVANRVSTIQDLTANIKWKHVNSKANPADIISRGCSVSELQNSMWFRGPEFLYMNEQFWPAQREYSSTDELPESRKPSMRNPTLSLIVVSDTSWLLETVYKTSSFTKNRRIFAYINRFITNLKCRITNQPLKLDSLTAAELNSGFMKMIYLVQQHEFKSDIEHLTKYQMVHHTSALKNLNPFINKTDGLLRVGGRLRNANLPYEARSPILLPKNNNLVNSYISFLHFRYCHAGPQALVSIIQQQFWIINARDYTRKIVRKCVHCFRYRPKLLNQIMGDLPADRVNKNLAFSVSGVDFCGPIYTSPTTRGHKMYKTYIAVFICFVSRGVHLEVVSDLSTSAFIAAIKRFISRRTLCKKLYCDNATNFVGARRQLAELRQQFLNQTFQSEIRKWCAENSIHFEHIPPRSPHFGGIWEAAVKSAKTLLYPTLQNSRLTYEHLVTVCCQIEAILNSRPITPMSTDPNDERALTPAHFWSQAPLETFVEPDLTNINGTKLSKWQHIQAIQQHFWKRWSAEYISSLQKRSKWHTESENIENGKLVLVHEDNLPPQKWLLGRVVQVFKGTDNKIRVAEIKTKCGILKRSIHKLAVLPIYTEN